MVIGNIFFQSLRLMKAAKPSTRNRFFPARLPWIKSEATHTQHFSNELGTAFA